MKLIIYTDGGSRGNPGPAGIGYVISQEDGEVLKEAGEFLGKATNNVAEYTALIRALEEGLLLGGSEVQVFADSELLVKQLKGEYRVKNEGLQPLFQKVVQLTRRYRSFKITHVPRAKNKTADALANRAMDEAAGKS